MGTTADKLVYLEETKADIRAALVEKGLDVPESTPFREYGDLIRTMMGAPAKKPLNDMTWEEISQVSKMGLAASYFAVGDTKSVKVTGTVGTVTVDNIWAVFILGIDHNPGYSNSGITFGCFKTAVSAGKDICLVDEYYETTNGGDTSFRWNSDRRTNDGWKGSPLRYMVLGSINSNSATDAPPDTATNPKENTLMSALPSDLREVIKPMFVLTDNDGKGGEYLNDLSYSIDYLPLMSPVEITGSPGGANPNEVTYQKQYDYFRLGKSAKKYKHNATSTAANYWTRSPSTEDYGIHITTTGTVGSGYTTGWSLGISPMFLV